MTDTHTDTEMVAIDILDAAELAEICAYLRDWIDGAPPAVNASLTRFAGIDAPATLLEALARLGDALIFAVPSVSPTLLHRPAPLGPGERRGLGELLVDLAVNGWPIDGDHAEAMAGDCRRWAMRLFDTPGMVE